jgi:hypothetical protein
LLGAAAVSVGVLAALLLLAAVLLRLVVRRQGGPAPSVPTRPSELAHS